jgi:hypothetical protein
MIDITKPVRTKCGDHVEIISDKGREPYTLVGYIGNGRELDEWAADGAYLAGTKSNNDLENYEPEPQPEPQPEEWAAEKAAFAAGKVIQFTDDAIHCGKWIDAPDPAWKTQKDDHAFLNPRYRIKPEQPEPQWVPMEPCDVPCLSLIKAGGVEAAVLRVSTHGVYICGLAGNIYEVEYDELFEAWQIKRPNEGWKPCKKEVQV